MLNRKRNKNSNDVMSTYLATFINSFWSNVVIFLSYYLFMLSVTHVGLLINKKERK